MIARARNVSHYVALRTRGVNVKERYWACLMDAENV